VEPKPAYVWICAFLLVWVTFVYLLLRVRSIECLGGDASMRRVRNIDVGWMCRE